MRWALVTTLLLTVLFSLLCTPLGGMETRAPSDTYPAGFAAVGVFFVGVILDVVTAVQLGRGKRAAPLGIAGAAMFYPVVLIEKLGFFAAQPPPPAIAGLELAGATSALVSIVLGVILWRQESAAEAPK
jgi:hypothetical protein